MHILFLLHNDISQEQKINKEIETLVKFEHRVTLFDFPLRENIIETPDHCKLFRIHIWSRKLPQNIIFWALKYLEIILRFVIQGMFIKPDVVHCVDRMTLIPGFLIAIFLRIPFVYDTQEIWSEVNLIFNKPKWLWLWLERSIARKASYVIVTDHYRLDIIAEILKLHRSSMKVLMNVPKRSSLKISARDIRKDVDADKKKLAVYIGSIGSGRHLEDILEAFKYLPDDYLLAIVGFGNEKYINTLHELASSLNIIKKFFILPPVQWSEVSEYIRHADCAFALYEKNTMNNIYCSPSKLFDALIVGVPVVGTDNPLISEVIKELNAGVCIDLVNPKKIAKAVINVCSRANQDVLHRRIEIDTRAKYTWEQQEKNLNCIYSDIARKTMQN